MASSAIHAQLSGNDQAKGQGGRKHSDAASERAEAREMGEKGQTSRLAEELKSSGGNELEAEMKREKGMVGGKKKTAETAGSAYALGSCCCPTWCCCRKGEKSERERESGRERVAPKKR